jgi:hypothetical protein
MKDGYRGTGPEQVHERGLRTGLRDAATHSAIHQRGYARATETQRHRETLTELSLMGGGSRMQRFPPRAYRSARPATATQRHTEQLTNEVYARATETQRHRDTLTKLSLVRHGGSRMQRFPPRAYRSARPATATQRHTEQLTNEVYARATETQRHRETLTELFLVWNGVYAAASPRTRPSRRASPLRCVRDQPACC